MSGAEIIGIVSGIIALLGAAHRVYRAVEDAAGLPPSFRDVGSRLPLIQDSLRAAQDGLAEEPASPDFTEALKAVLDGCRLKAAGLEKIFRATIPPAGATRVTRCLKALCTIPNGHKVESLMDGILGDLHVLTASHAFKAATRAQMKELLAAAAAGVEVEDIQRPTLTLHNQGSGSQFLHAGAGNQNVAGGKGSQFNGAMTGNFYLAHRD